MTSGKIEKYLSYVNLSPVTSEADRRQKFIIRKALCQILSSFPARFPSGFEGRIEQGEKRVSKKRQRYDQTQKDEHENTSHPL